MTRYECKEDPRNWIETNKSVWTRGDVRRWAEAVQADVAASTGGEFVQTKTQEYYNGFIAKAHLVDVNGKEYNGVEEIFGANFEDVDGAVERFWGTLPRMLFDERSRLGERIRAV